jgi:spore maturation protein CgeD
MGLKVTIILTSYNKPKTVGKSIESVLNQTMTDWELFIMDDASNEETQDVIQRYLADSRIQYFNSHIKNEDRHKTTRYATLINEALSKGTGKYISYLTDDTTYMPHRLEVMTNVFEQTPSIDVVYSKQQVKMVDENLNIVSEKIRNTKGVLLKPQNLVDHCSVMHHRRIANKVLKRFGSYWDDHPINWHNADAAFWTRLTMFAPFYPIDEILDVSLKTPKSFQSLNAFLPDIIPNGVLIKGLSDKVYLIENGKRREITFDMFEKLRYLHRKIVEVPDPVMFKYEEDEKIDASALLIPEKFPNYRLVKEKKNSAIYYIEHNQKRLIINIKAFNKYKFNWKEVIEIESDLLRKIPNGLPINPISQKHSPLPSGLSCQLGGKYFIIQEHSLHPIDVRVMNKLKYEEPFYLTIQEASQFQKGEQFDWKINQWN